SRAGSARPRPAAEGSTDGGEGQGDPRRPPRDDDQVDPPGGGNPLGRPAAVGGGRARGDVGLPPRHPRRADGGARRRADGAGARAGQPPRRAGPQRRAHLAQSPRHLRDGDADHRPAPWAERGRLRAGEHIPGRSRARDHRRAADEGLGNPQHWGRVGVTAASPVVDPAALPRTVLDRVRTGNLGSWPVIFALAIVVVVFSQTAQNFFTPANFTNYLFPTGWWGPPWWVPGGWTLAVAVIVIYLATNLGSVFADMRHGIPVRNPIQLALRLLVVPVLSLLIVWILNKDRGVPLA